MGIEETNRPIAPTQRLAVCSDLRKDQNSTMNNLPTKTTIQLIEGLQSGQIDMTEAAKRIASVHVAQSESYSQTLVIGIVLAGIAWALTGTGIIPAAIALLTWDSFTQQRQTRKQAFEHIARGEVFDYLPDRERELFAELDPEAPAKPSIVQTPTLNLLGIEVTDVAAAIGQTLKPMFVTARPRVGKGILLSHAIAAAKSHHAAAVWVIQPKPATHELGYWKQCDRFLGIKLEGTEKNDAAIAIQLTQFFLEWRAQAHRPCILIIDELVMLKALQPKWCDDFLTAQVIVESSSGETDKRFLWVMSASPLCSDIGLSGGNRSAFDLLTLQTETTKEHLASFKKSVTSLPGVPSDDDYQRSPVGILTYHTSHGWSALPSYDVPQIGPGDRLCPELQTWVQAGSNSGSNLEPGSNLGSTSEPGSSLGSNDEPYTPQAVEGNSPPSVHGSVQAGSDLEPVPNRVRMVLELNRRGWTQTDVIEFLWGVKKGGTDGYKKAVAEFKAIVSEYGE